MSMEAGRLWPHDIVETLVKNFNEVQNSTKLKKNLKHQLLSLISSNFFITILKKIPPKVQKKVCPP